MNFPVNGQKLREDLHRAVDRESLVNVIILLMLIRVVQVISWLRPGEREIKRIKASNATVHLSDGTEIPVFPIVDREGRGVDGTGPHRRQLTAGDRRRLRLPEHVTRYRNGDWSVLSSDLEALYHDYQRDYGPFQRDLNWELDVIAASRPNSPEWESDGEGGYTFTYDILAKCVTTAGQVQILHRNPRGNLIITVPINQDEEIVAREISAVYMAFLVNLDDAMFGRRAASPPSPFTQTQNYARDEFGRPRSEGQIRALADSLAAPGPIDLSEHLGMSVSFPGGYTINIDENTLEYCQSLAEGLRAAQVIEMAIRDYRRQVSHSNNPHMLRPMELAWATTPGNEVATLTIGTNGVLITEIIEKTPKEAALETPEICMSYLRMLYESDGLLERSGAVSGYCTPYRDRWPMTGPHPRHICSN